MDGVRRRRPHDHDLFRDGNCPSCGVKTAYDGWWCSDCLKANVRAARAALDPCWCREFPSPHRHHPDGGLL